jgi:short-subunit dehydrogenase
MRTVLLTGATGGIGKALAERFEALGDRVVRVGRRPSEEGLYCRADLSAPGAVDRIDSFLAENGIDRLDLLIHNAAVGYYGRVGEQGRESIDELLAVNLETPIELTRRLYTRLRAAEGKVVFVNSVASALPCARYAVYAATKAALAGFARALRVEWAGRVRVQSLFPGAVNSGMHAKMGISKETIDWDRFPSVDETVDKMIAAMKSHRAEVSIGSTNAALRTAGNLAGGVLDSFVARGRDGGIERAGAKANGVPLCLVTGAAEGIGYATAVSFARAGAKVLGVDVNGRKIAEAIQSAREEDLEIEFITADLGSNAGIDRVLNAVAERGLASTVVHNAGISWLGRFEDGELPEDRAVLRLNLRAPLQLTAGLLERGLFARGGNFAFVSSLSRFVGYPGAAVYAASKDGVASFARSLRAGLHGAGGVVTVYPGPTRTAHARRYSPDNSREERRMSPAEVAEAIVSGVRSGGGAVVPGWGNRLACALGSLVPRVTEAAMKRAVYNKIGKKTT